jgi:pyridoxal phosphate enzyme (YggS family)
VECEVEFKHIEANLNEINARIEEAADKSGRSRKDILLVAVTKTIDVPSIKKKAELGVMDFGENKVQEYLLKRDKITVDWHLIGHLQTNKVKSVVGAVKLIHSVDSLKVALEIDKKAQSAGVVQDILIEVNIADEDTKFGVSQNNVKELIEALWGMSAIKVKGLMTVAPFVDEGEKNRDLFKKMRQLLVDIKEISPHNKEVDILSMGMSGDYETAIEEGANIVRIGSAIFGKRS